MTETPAPDQNNQPQGEDLGEEFRNLGKNLVDFLHAAWDSPESQRLKQEAENTLHELSGSLNKAADEFKNSEKGQQLKQDFEDLKQRVASGEVETKARTELLNALRKVNEELAKTSERWKANKPPENQ
jgi:hypothetical protein